VIELADKKSLDVFTKQTSLVSKAFVEMGKQLKPNVLAKISLLANSTNF